MKKMLMTCVATVLLGLGFGGFSFYKQQEVHAETTDAGNKKHGKEVSRKDTTLQTKTNESTYFDTHTSVTHATSKKGQAAGDKHEMTGNKTLTMEATAYTASCEGCSGITRTGINLLANPDKKVIAVDPDVIPLGSKVHVEGYGTAIAGDIGSDIQGNRIDIFIPKRQDALEFGRKPVKVEIIS
ncbi:3D domain-containing protein [Pontibacillus salicampi]|uniref:3D domain-containing protein n=1 Tax=Pontibacillus salicampi TaxID=1449801 RepID=A0ABV6LQ20_9BACI